MISTRIGTLLRPCLFVGTFAPCNERDVASSDRAMEQTRSRPSRPGQTERANVGTNADSAGGPVCAVRSEHSQPRSLCHEIVGAN